MIYRNLIILFIFFYLTIYNINGDEAAESVFYLDIDNAVNMALKNNLGIEKNKIVLNKYKWAMATSLNRFIPDVSLKLLMTHSNEEKSQLIPIKNPVPRSTVIPDAYDYVIENDIPQWSVGMKFDLTFALNMSQLFGVYQTVLDWRNNKISLEIAEKKLTRDIQKNYYNLIIMEKSILLMQEKIKNSKERYEQAVNNKETGKISEIDELSAQASYENLKPVLMDLENNYEQALLSFKQMVGIKENINIIFISSVPEKIDYNFLSKKSLNNLINRKLEIQALKLSLKNINNYRNISIFSLTPTFLLGYSMDPFYIKDPTDNENSDWFSDVDDEWVQKTGMFTIGFSLPLSSWAFFSKEQMKIIDASYSIMETKQTIEQLNDATEIEVQSILLKLKKAKESIDALKINIQLSKKVYEMTNDAYKLGLKQLLEVQEAEKELENARLNLLKKQYEYAESILDIEYILNTNLEELLNHKENNYEN